MIHDTRSRLFCHSFLPVSSSASLLNGHSLHSPSPSFQGSGHQRLCSDWSFYPVPERTFVVSSLRLPK
uniref:Uncharacterized protein n=1 Tax=Utricularia reniformis TaxID=192314 RepID=A0A1Y0AZK4_9LAMI|nr:hypothetical protein AEK19_MT0340 [Utricularia reniformis]ART30612.1 hypothetical protein AEK19_MT0340 [Utricularia reniformis]